MASQLKLKNFQGITEGKPDFEAREILIQCSFCHTKYSVPTNSIAGLDKPKFHCFRCESVFEIETDTAAQDFRPVFPSATIEHMSSPSKNFTAEPTFDGGLKMKSQSSPWKIETKIESKNPSLPKESKKEFSFGSFNPAAHIPKLDLSWGKRASVSQPENKIATYEKTERGESLLAKYAALLLPGFILLSLMLAAAVFAPKMADLGFDLSKVLPSAKQIVPPAAIGVENLQIHKTSLPGGDQVFLLNGDIFNHSDNAFAKVVLEGMVFDSKGRKLSAVQTLLGNDLSGVKVESLNKEMLADLISAPRSAKKVTQESRDKFSLAFTEDFSPEARFFSARIYSAQIL